MRAARRAATVAAAALTLGIAGAALSAPVWADADTEPGTGSTAAQSGAQGLPQRAQSGAQSLPQRARAGGPDRAARPARAEPAAAVARRSTARPPAARDAAPADAVKPARTARAVTVDVELPPVPVADGWSFTVSRAEIAGRARDYVTAGGDPADAPRFFFGDLAVASLDALAASDVTAQRQRVELGNLAVSGYFGGVWLRDNLRAPAPPAVSASDTVPATDPLAAIGIRIFDALAVGLTQAAAARNPWLVTTASRVTVPVLLTLYGYNRGYLEYLLDNPPAGVTPMRDTLSCTGFLSCSSEAFPLEIGDRYDAALDDLAAPPDGRWREMAIWSSLLENATGTGRFVWSLIGSGGFSAASYQALVELSSAYLMISKAAVLSAMTAYADADPEVGRSSLRLQAGLWMWSGAYFGGLASVALPGTLPAITVS